MGTIRLKGEADLRGIEKEYDKVEAKNRKLRGSLGMNAAASKKGSLQAKKDLNVWKKGIVDLHKENAKLEAQKKKSVQLEKDAAQKRRQQTAEEIRSAAQRAQAQQAYNTRLKQLHALYNSGKIDQKAYYAEVNRAQQQLQAGLRGTEKASRSAFGPKMLGMLGSVAGALGLGGGGIAGALAVVSKAYGVWLENVREIARESRKAANEMVAFAALQEGGTKAERVERAMRLGAKYGITDRGGVFNAVQALQSALGGDFEGGMEAAETVFAATRVAIPLEQALETEIVGISQGAKPGESIRRAYVAGQASARNPALLATAGAAIPFFDDRDFAYGVFAQLAPTYGQQLAVYARQAGVALSGVGTVQKGFEKQAEAEVRAEMKLGKTKVEKMPAKQREQFQKGIAERLTSWGVGEGATRQERLRALVDRGIDTEEELVGLGVNEIRQRGALRELIKGFETVERITTVVRERAKPGVFAEQRAEVETELPTLKTTGMLEQLRSQYLDMMARDDEAAKIQLEQSIRAIAMKRLGYETAGWFALREKVGEDYLSTKWDEFQAIVTGTMTLGGQRDLHQEMARIHGALERGEAIPEDPRWGWPDQRGLRPKLKLRAIPPERPTVVPPPPPVAARGGGPVEDIDRVFSLISTTVPPVAGGARAVPATRAYATVETPSLLQSIAPESEVVAESGAVRDVERVFSLVNTTVSAERGGGGVQTVEDREAGQGIRETNLLLRQVVAGISQLVPSRSMPPPLNINAHGED